MRNRHLFLLDAAALVVAPVIAFLVRFEDFGWLGQNLRMVLPYILLAGPVRLFVFYNLGMYRRLWRHASIGELKQILVAGGIAAIFAAAIGFWIMPASQISARPRSVLGRLYRRLSHHRGDSPSQAPRAHASAKESSPPPCRARPPRADCRRW